MDAVSDLISVCLSIQPVPGLHFAFTTLTWIVNTTKQVQDSKEQIGTLTLGLAQLMKTVNEQYKQGKLIERDTKTALHSLETLLDDIRRFVEAQAKNSVFGQIISANKRLSTIDTFHRRLTLSVNAFQVAALVDTQHLLSLNEQARQKDQQQLHQMLRDLESNQRRLMDALDINKNEPVAMMAALQRRIGERGEDSQDNLTRFYTTSLRYLTTTSGKKVDVTPWTITSFDVEFGPQIGAGGFGTVYRGKWNEMDVAIKVMRGGSGDAIPRAVTVRREVDAWSRLRHPHILQFLGANILDTKPFIVTPYLEQGNAAEYVLKNPDCKRLDIIYHICLGLTYLHTQRVIHGDIKGTNVLIDDSGKAVLCDFGLARIKADVNSRTVYGKGSEAMDMQMGSQNWMAPELFEGSSLRITSDIYSLGMTIYELFTGEVPLSNIHPVRFQDAVINNTRPQRPDEYDAPQLTDQIWTIAAACWAKHPESRPTAESLCRDIKFILDAPPMPVPDTSYATRPAIVVSPLPPPPLNRTAPAPLPIRVDLARNVSRAQRANTAPVSVMSPTISHPPARPIVDSSLPTKRPYKRCLILKKPNSNIVCAALSPNGKVYLTGHDDGILRSWDAVKGVSKRDYAMGSQNIITGIAFSPTTSLRYAAASVDPRRSMTSVYLVLKDKSTTCLHPEVSAISNLTIMSDETIVGVECQGNEASLVVWKRVKNGRTTSWAGGMKLPLLGLDSLPEPLTGCGFVISPDGKTIWTGNTSRSIFTSMVETGQQHERPLHLGSDELTSGPIRNEAAYYTAASTSSVLEPLTRSPSLVCLACAPDGKKIAVSYATGEILVLDLRSKKVKTMRDPTSSSDLHSPSLQAKRAPPVIFSDNGSRIIYPCNVQQKTIQIQDVATNVILSTVHLADCPPNNDISFISVTPNFKHITCSFTHGTHALVYIWD